MIVALINECIINAIAKETSATYSKINHFDRVASKKCSIIYNKESFCPNKCGIIDINVTLSPNKCGKMDLNVEEISQLRTIAYNMLLLWLIQGCNGCIIEQKPCEIVFYFFIIVINLSVIGSMRLANLPLTTASALNSLVPFVSMLENGAFSKTFRHQSTISVGLDQSLYILSKLSL